MPGQPMPPGGPVRRNSVDSESTPPGFSTRPISKAAYAASWSSPKCSIEPEEKIPSNMPSG